MSERQAVTERKTGETEIRLELVLDGSGGAEIESGVGFLDHMLTLLARHSHFDIKLNAVGDLHVDEHHVIEDIGIVLGQALASALGDKAGIQRYGSAMIPMDEVLVAAAVDLSGRSYYKSDYKARRELVGDFPTEMVNHFFHSLAVSAGMNLHLRLLDPGENEHHRIEGIFKAVARALREAVSLDPDLEGVIPSTKGVL